MGFPGERIVKFRCLILLFLLTSGPLAADNPLAFASGSWYDPNRSGEGFVVQLLPDGRAVVTWFTYPPEGEDSQQAWLIGSGTIDGNRIVITKMVRPVGASFGPDFDPDDVVREYWGTLEITFADCDTAIVTWEGPPEFGSGTMDLVRLSSIDDVECATAAESGADRVISGRSGPWYDRGHSGEGWLLEMLPDGRMVVYWFTFDDQGRQVWMIGVARVEGKTLLIEDMRIAHGTHFGDAFQKDDVILEHWGSFGLFFDACAIAQIRYASTDARFGEGTLEPVQLAQLAETNCDEPPPAEPMTGGSWRLSTETDVAISESASAAAGRYVYTGGGFGHFSRFQRFEPASGTYTDMPDLPGPRHHPMMTTDGHDIYVAGGFQSKFGLDNAGNNFWRFDPDVGAWEILPNMPRVRAAGAAVYLHGYVWIMGGEGTGAENLRYNIRAGEWELSLRAPKPVYDHIQAVAFENEIWWMGGRTASNRTFSHVMIWNLVTETWRDGPPMFFPRAGFAARVVKGQIIVSGGEQLDSFPSQLTPSTEVFAPGAESWVTGPRAPVAVHGTTGAVINGKFVLTAGSSIAGATSDNRATQILTPATPPP